jgi:uncharacterized membrane protein YhfC
MDPSLRCVQTPDETWWRTAVLFFLLEGSHTHYAESAYGSGTCGKQMVYLGKTSSAKALFLSADETLAPNLSLVIQSGGQHPAAPRRVFAKPWLRAPTRKERRF